MSEKRRATRHHVSIVAKLTINGTAHDYTLVNLSMGGALVAGTRQTMGTRVQISFHIPTLEHAIDVGATVRWADDNGIGLQFDGLRARETWALGEFFKQLG